MNEITLKVAGMTCGGCVKSVTGVLQALDGVANADVSLAASEARVQYDPARTSPTALCAAIDDAGFEASLPPSP